MNSETITRRRFMKASAAGIALCSSPDLLGEGERKDRPNIVWIVSEDNSPLLGCYGDANATTPHLDRLAAEGVRYSRAFANAPVCAPARFTILTGRYAPGMGAHHMRSNNRLPATVGFLPHYLRRSGYYCSNCSKEDYNAPVPDDLWDDSSPQAHYRNRGQGQPFFSVFNIGVTHESGLHRRRDELRHDPEKMVLPPYHPDTPEMRYDRAQYYDLVEEMDTQVGERLRELQAAGLADDTIIFYYSDHGGALARGKRFLYDSGVRVPLIVRFPEKFRHLAPVQPGGVEDRMVSFIDLAPTMLSLANAPIPAELEGTPFLGVKKEPPPSWVHLHRDRMDERIDLMRGVSDGQYKYIRNYLPHRIYGQHLDYLWRAPSVASWERAFHAGRCNAAQSAYWRTKPVEELYDTRSDPHEVHNLAHDPAHEETLVRMRRANRDWITARRDAGFWPEGDLLEAAREGTIHDRVHDPLYPMERVLDTAERASNGKAGEQPLLIERLDDEHAAVRYWAATGCVVLGSRAADAVPVLLKRLDDESTSVRIAAAEALCGLGRSKDALPRLVAALHQRPAAHALHALNALDALGDQAAAALDSLKSVAEEARNPFVQWAAEYLVKRFDG